MVSAAELGVTHVAGRRDPARRSGWVGLVNGLVVTRLRINALIATLAMSFVVCGAGALITHGNLVGLYDHPSFGDLARTMIFTVRSVDLDRARRRGVIGVLWPGRTSGRYIYAVGGNAEAARLAGVRVARVRGSRS